MEGGLFLVLDWDRAGWENDFLKNQKYIYAHVENWLGNRQGLIRKISKWQGRQCIAYVISLYTIGQTWVESQYVCIGLLFVCISVCNGDIQWLGCELEDGSDDWRWMYTVERKVRQPGIEPGSTAWKATMLTFTPPTLDDLVCLISQPLALSN